MKNKTISEGIVLFLLKTNQSYVALFFCCNVLRKRRIRYDILINKNFNE